MAGKSDTDKALENRARSLDTVMGQIEKSFGKGAVMRLGDEVRAPIEVIPTGAIALDVALGIGGLPRGRVVEIYGPESSGKTTVALHAVANAQRNGGIAAFIDAEHALDPEYAQKLGVDTDALLVSQPDTGEQALEIADMLIRSGALDIIVIDSVAALVPRAEIEGEMGDSHVGLQARLMSQALRKITGALNSTGTTAIFINQLREKIGVMFGCMSYATRVTLADGSTEEIGKLVDTKAEVQVRTYDPESDRIVARPITNWFDNGQAERFLRFEVAGGDGVGRSTFSSTENHLIRTPAGWREAGEIIAGDRVMVTETARLSPTQWQLVLGALLGAADLTAGAGGAGVQYRMGHAGEQVAYLDWKVEMLANVPHSRSADPGAVARVDFCPLAELAEVHRVLQWGDGRKHLSQEHLKVLTPLSLAVWFMDASISTGKVGSAGGQMDVRLGVEALSRGSRDRLVEYLRDTHGVDSAVTVDTQGQAVLRMTRAGSERFQQLVAPHVHSSMDHLLPEGLRGQFVTAPEYVEAHEVLMPAEVSQVRVEPRGDSMRKFDIEVGGTHNYFVDGVMVHNSPETTTGGKALKFYASVRLDVRRIETLKDGNEPVGNRTRVKVVKNKVSPPFKQAEFDILYGQGISREGGLIDMGVDQGFVRKSGAWYTYDGDQLGQGKENARNFLKDNPDLADELEKRIKEKLGVGPRVDAPATGTEVPVEF